MLLLALAIGSLIQNISAQTPSAEITLWQEIKAGLQAADGATFFESSLKGALVPSGAKGLHGLKGTVVTSRPVDRPSEVVLAISDTKTPEVTVRFIDKQGRPDRLKKPIAPGTKVAFAGVVSEYSKDPFMLTLESQMGDNRDGTFTAIVEAFGEPAAMPSISVNYPSRLAARFVNISLDGLPQHKFTADDHGVPTEMTGVLLDRFLSTAGWHGRYSIQVDGAQTSLSASDLGPGTFKQRAWLIFSNAKPEASLVIVDGEGMVAQRVEAIQRILVREQHRGPALYYNISASLPGAALRTKRVVVLVAAMLRCGADGHVGESAV